MNPLRSTALAVGLLLAGFAAGMFANHFLLSKTALSDWAKTLNTDYANLLTFGATILLVLVTVIYAGYTYRQVVYSRKQFLLNKQPYVIPSLITKNFSDFEESKTQYTRTLKLEYRMANVGTETAFSVQPFISISYPDEEGNLIRLKAATAPAASAYLAPGDEQTGIFSLYENGTDENNEGVSLIYPSFGYLLTETGDIVAESERSAQKRFPVLAVKVYCRNLVGQWFVSTIYEDITAVTPVPETESKPYPRAVVRYRLETSQTIQHLPLEIQEVSEAEVRKEFSLHGKEAGFLQTEDT